MSWGKYVPVAKRREKAEKKMAALAKKGKVITPVKIKGRIISSSIWGKAWCEHIESFRDYDNRLPRGKTYVRNGSVCHLEINAGEVLATVSGSALYQVKIVIKKLQENKWLSLKVACSGQVTSLLDLLSGKLSESVMEQMCSPSDGLFPRSSEIDFSCNCPDWADMCKHIAAVFYGVASRLDDNPSDLFYLRGVNHEELIDVSKAVDDLVSNAGSNQRLASDDLNALFGFELSEDEPPQPVTVKPLKTAPPVKKTRKKAITGNAIKKQRKKLGLTQVALAIKIKVSAAIISKWEAFERKKVTSNQAALARLTEWFESSNDDALHDPMDNV